MSEDKNQAQPKSLSIKIKLDDDMAMGKYVNLMMINHTPTEFVVDGIFVPPGQSQGQVLSRQILSPANAKRLLMALGDNINKFEQRFGPIALPPMPKVESVVH